LAWSHFVLQQVEGALLKALSDKSPDIRAALYKVTHVSSFESIDLQLLILVAFVV
jgi:hypothetical protein